MRRVTLYEAVARVYDTALLRFAFAGWVHWHRRRADLASRLRLCSGTLQLSLTRAAFDKLRRWARLNASLTHRARRFAETLARERRVAVLARWRAHMLRLTGDRVRLLGTMLREWHRWTQRCKGLRALCARIDDAWTRAWVRCAFAAWCAYTERVRCSCRSCRLATHALYHSSPPLSPASQSLPPRFRLLASALL